jgi:hypothetical protein
MKRVTGIGGVFFKSKDPKKLGEWYRTHLGMNVEEWGGVAFRWATPENEAGIGSTIWSPFKEDTEYFEPSKASFMINYRVEDFMQCWPNCAAKAARWTQESRNPSTASLVGSWTRRKIDSSSGSHRQGNERSLIQSVASVACRWHPVSSNVMRQELHDVMTAYRTKAERPGILPRPNEYAWHELKNGEEGLLLQSPRITR